MVKARAYADIRTSYQQNLLDSGIRLDMHCYVISLPTATKRLERTKHELEAYCPKLSWSVPPMYVASEMSDEQFAAVYDSAGAWKMHNRDLSHGEIACALSHQSALKEFLASEDECCLIVEDDVLFSPVIGEFLEGLAEWMKGCVGNPTCVVLSEAAAVRYWTARRWIGEIKRTRPSEIYGAIAYVVNRAGAEAILDNNPVPIHTMSDQWSYYGSHGLDVFGTEKILAGSFDFDRGDSSLSVGRAEVYRKSCERRVELPLFRRKIMAAKAYAKKLWWMLSGVSVCSNRTNVNLYMCNKRD